MKIEIRQTDRAFPSERLDEFSFVIHKEDEGYGSSLKGESHGKWLSKHHVIPEPIFKGDINESSAVSSWKKIKSSMGIQV